MKHYMLIATIIASTNLIITMEPESRYEKTIVQQAKSSKANDSHYSNLKEVKAAAEGKPSITLINSDKEENLRINMGDLNKDSMTTSLSLFRNTQITLCPYLFPDSLNKKQIQNGAIIKLSLITQRLRCFVPYIDGNPAIRHKERFTLPLHRK